MRTGQHRHLRILPGCVSRQLLTVTVLLAAVIRCAGTNPAPQPPQMLSAAITAQSAPFVTLTWHAAANARSYTVLRKANDEPLFDEVALVTETAWTDYGVYAGSRYFYTVTAVGDGGVSGPSAQDSVVTDAYMILAPRDGDLFRIGDTLPVRLSAAEGVNAMMQMTFDNGENYIAPRFIGIQGTFTPAMVPELRMTIPPLIVELRLDPQTGMPVADTIVPVSDLVRFRLVDYSNPDVVLAESNGFFSIVP